MDKTQTEYTQRLKASDYDFLKVFVNEESGRIKIEFLDTRWRTKQETIDMLGEVIAILSKPF